MTQAELLKEEYNQENKNEVLYSNSDPEYDEWFRAEVAKDVEDGKVISQEEAERILYQLLPLPPIT